MLLDYLQKKSIHQLHHVSQTVSTYGDSRTGEHTFIKLGMGHISSYTPNLIKIRWSNSYLMCFCCHLSHNLLNIYQKMKYCEESCREMKHPLLWNTCCTEHVVLNIFSSINLTVFESIKGKKFSVCHHLISFEMILSQVVCYLCFTVWI